MEREYVVTLKSRDDLNSFYDDMESNSRKKFVPKRSVEVAARRPISRNTHYWLTDEEANILKQDKRVLAVELSNRETGTKNEPLLWTQQSSSWSKAETIQPTDLNWGILRCYEGANRPGWGLASDATGFNYASGTVNLTNIGRNVDVIIMDGVVKPGHPEYARNPDGTGGTRLIQYNWFQHNPEVLGTAAGTYPYSSYLNNTANKGSNDHGTHVAGTACGNTLGWARGANIYNMFVFDEYSEYHIDYVRAFHAAKPINPLTGYKNPTICNMSYTATRSLSMNQITSIKYRGQTFTKPSGGWTNAQRIQYGLVALRLTTPSALYIRVAATDADMIDATEDGIIMVGAAGNNSMKNAAPDDPDYDNYLIYNLAGAPRTIFYHRGSSQGAAPTAICVGSIDVTAIKNNGVFSGIESKADYSCNGSRNDIYSPGTEIMGPYITSTINDPRNSSFKLIKISGTSMATPQVCGVLACQLETMPHLKQSDALEYLIKYSQKDVILDRNSGYDDLFALQGSPNRYLKFRLERNLDGAVYPKNNYYQFKNTKVVYPKPRIRRKG